MEEMIEKSYSMGYQASPDIASSPYLNKEFMDFIPNCDFGNESVVKLRIKMYQAYIKGWTKGHLDKVWSVE